jgi:hypothetical protein
MDSPAGASSHLRSVVDVGWGGVDVRLASDGMDQRRDRIREREQEGLVCRGMGVGKAETRDFMGEFSSYQR